MSIETPLGFVTVNCNNLLHQQCAEEFLKLINSDPVWLLQQLQSLNINNPTQTLIRG